jgi:hypothetical protein
VVALAAIFTLLPGAPAQVPFEVAPYVGYYLPSGSMLLPAPPSQMFTNPYGPAVTSVVQGRTVAFGGHVTAWLAPRLGLEATLSYAPSGVNLYAVKDGYVATGGAKLVVVPLTFLGVLSFHVSGGVGFVDHNGSAYADVGGTTRAVPTVGAGIAVRAGGSRVLRIDVQHFSFRPHLYVQGCIHTYAMCNALRQPNIPGFQHDVILSIGLGFRIGGTRAAPLRPQGEPSVTTEE